MNVGGKLGTYVTGAQNTFSISVPPAEEEVMTLVTTV